MRHNVIKISVLGNFIEIRVNLIVIAIKLFSDTRNMKLVHTWILAHKRRNIGYTNSYGVNKYYIITHFI